MISLEHNNKKILELIKYGEFVKYLSDISFTKTNFKEQNAFWEANVAQVFNKFPIFYEL